MTAQANAQTNAHAAAQATAHDDERAERACERLSIAFAIGVDRFDDDAVLNLFTHDGVFNRPGNVVKGRDALHGWLKGRPRDVVTRHICTNISIKVINKKEASGITYFTFYRGAKDGEPSVLPLHGPDIVGEYLDRFLLTDDGWRIAERAVAFAFQKSNP
jgi:hypothetical protein